MPRDPFEPISRRKLLVYVSIAAAIIVGGCAWHLYLGGPRWRVALLGGFAVVMFAGVVGGTLWLTGGERSSIRIGAAGIRPSHRFLKFFPYLIGIVVALQLIRLLTFVAPK